MRKFLAASLLLTVFFSLGAQNWRDGFLYRRALEDRPVLWPSPDTVSVIFIGDVMMHSRQLEYDWSYFLAPIKDRLENADIAVANMEFPLGGKPYTGYPLFSTPDEYADYIASCGVDIFLGANNHVLDKGKEGLEKTLAYYRDMEGIRFTGFSGDEDEDLDTYPLIVVAGGIKIALINFTYGTNIGIPDKWPKVNRTDRKDIASAFSRAKEKGADYIIALPHWGVEYELRHSSSQESLAKWLVSQGADAVIGAHPHVVQDSTNIDKVPVYYSLGNAVSNMSLTNTRLELAVTLSFIPDMGGNHTMLAPKTEFLWCTLPGKLTDSYATIAVRDWLGKRDEWKEPADYDNMVATYERVKAATGIKD